MKYTMKHKKIEPWWPLEYQNNTSADYLTAKPCLHPVVGLVERHISTHEYWLSSRSTRWGGVVYRGTGDAVEDETALRCLLLELAHSGGNDG